MRMGIVIEMKQLGSINTYKSCWPSVFRAKSESLVFCPQPQYSFILERHHCKNLDFTKTSQQNQMQLFLEANRTHQLCLLILFSAHRKLALKGSTDKGDFEKLLTNC